MLASDAQHRRSQLSFGVGWVGGWRGVWLVYLFDIRSLYLVHPGSPDGSPKESRSFTWNQKILSPYYTIHYWNCKHKHTLVYFYLHKTCLETSFGCYLWARFESWAKHGGFVLGCFRSEYVSSGLVYPRYSKSDHGHSVGWRILNLLLILSRMSVWNQAVGWVLDVWQRREKGGGASPRR